MCIILDSMKMKFLFSMMLAIFAAFSMSVLPVMAGQPQDGPEKKENPDKGWGIGISAGYAYNMLSIPDAYDYDRHYSAGDGFYVAIPVKYNFNDWFALSGELAAVSKNYSSYRSMQMMAYPWEKVENYYLSVPVYAQFSFGGKKLRGFVNAGIYAGAWLYSHRQGESLGPFDSVLYPYDEAVPFDSRRDNRFDAGLLAGLGLKYRAASCVEIFAEGRYMYALTDMQKQYRGHIPRYSNTMVVQAGAVFMF